MARTEVSHEYLVPGKHYTSAVMTEIDAANGMVLSPREWEYPVNARTILLIANTAAADKTVTIKGTDNPRAQNRDDLVVTVPGGGFVAVQLDHSRTRQFDGSTLIDFEAGMTGLIGAFQVRA